MRTLDMAPLFRSSVGFDNLSSIFDSVWGNDKGSAFPPYNIELLEEDKYRITMAVAGFKQEEIEIVSERNSLKITGSKKVEEKKEEANYLYRGIAARNFERKFKLADHVKVTGAKLEDGLLQVDLEREIPEAMKPRKIEIQSSSDRLIESH